MTEEQARQLDDIFRSRVPSGLREDAIGVVGTNLFWRRMVAFRPLLFFRRITKMRNVFFLTCCVIAVFALIGCSQGSPGPVTTDEDEILEYERRLNEGEGEGDEEIEF